MPSNTKSNNLIVGLDIGTTKICAIAVEGDNLDELNVVGVGTAKSDGLRKGVVVNIEKTVKAIKKAVSFLAEKQQADGSIHDKGNQTTMTSLSLMAMAAVGHQPVNPTAEGRVMRRSLDYVLREDRQDDQGYFGNRDGGRMYGHGIITLMLSEMLGMGLDEEQDQRIRSDTLEARRVQERGKRNQLQTAPLMGIG